MQHSLAHDVPGRCSPSLWGLLGRLRVCGVGVDVWRNCLVGTICSYLGRESRKQSWAGRKAERAARGARPAHGTRRPGLRMSRTVRTRYCTFAARTFAEGSPHASRRYPNCAPLTTHELWAAAVVERGHFGPRTSATLRFCPRTALQASHCTGRRAPRSLIGAIVKPGFRPFSLYRALRVWGEGVCVSKRQFSTSVFAFVQFFKMSFENSMILPAALSGRFFYF